MRNRFLFLVFLLFVIITAWSQEITRKDADSMIIALKKSKQDINRIDLLLNLAQFHIFKPGESEIDFDSARVYINEAKSLNKTVKSSTANGYILLTESGITNEKGNKEVGKKMAEQAVSILETGINKTYLGRAYYQLSLYYAYDDPEQLPKKIALVQKAVTAFEQSGNLKAKARALEMLGDLYSEADNFAGAILILKQAQAAYDSIKYPALQGVYILLGSSYRELNEYGQALFYDLKALKTAQTLRDTSMQLCQIYNQIAALYNDIGMYDISLKYFWNALEIAQKSKDESAVVSIVTSMSSTFYEINQPVQALKVIELFPKKIMVSNNPDDRYRFNVCYLRAYLQTKEFNKAKPYLGIVLEFADKKMIPEIRRCNAYRFITEYYFGTKHYAKARHYLTKSIRLAEKINHEYSRVQGLRLSYVLDSTEGNFRSANKHLLSYKAKTDSISSEKTRRQFQVLGVEYEVGMKEDSIKLKDKDITLLKERNSLQQANVRQARLVRNVTIGGIILASIIIGLLYRQYRQKQKSNQLITQKNDQLQHLLVEKEWLLKEIHHRVKNNMQTVMSLLNSQTAYINNDAALTAIHDSQHRVHAMSLIHQKLYSSENVSSINMSVYIRELVSYLSESFDAGKRIRFELNIEPLEMDVSQAVPLGLILNEAITNSIKYAFPGDRNGVISISLIATGADHYLLTISDNGIGIHADLKKAGSLGMSLMKGLSEDIDGIFSIENNNGTIIKISFVHDSAVKNRTTLAESFISNN